MKPSEREARDEEKSHAKPGFSNMASRENSPVTLGNFLNPIACFVYLSTPTNVSESEDGLWSGKHFLALRGAVFQLQEFALPDFRAAGLCL